MEPRSRAFAAAAGGRDGRTPLAAVQVYADVKLFAAAAGGRDGRTRPAAPAAGRGAVPPAPAAEGRGRRRGSFPGLLALVLAAAVLPAPAAGQRGPYPIFTEAHLDATMTTLGPNVAGVRAALAAGDHAAAKERAIRSREQLAVTITFWRDRRRQDAVAWLRSALDRLDALDTALSAEPVDAAAAAAIADELAEACAACHAAYREEDGGGGYRLKTSALP